MTSQTGRYVERAIADNGVVELRHLPSKKTGWFDNTDDLLACARPLASSGNLFISLNRPGPMVASNAMTGRAVGNDDIQFITRLFFDFDPVKPSGVSATDDEQYWTKRKAEECLQLLRAMGFPDPLFASSGNGTHLLYRCHLPNTAEIRERLDVIYAGMKKYFSNEQVSFDSAVRNPGRICTMYGSKKRKGDHTPDRPHRLSSITSWPRDWKQVPRKNIEALASFYTVRDQPEVSRRRDNLSPTAKSSGDGDYTTLDAVAWFAAHGLYEHHIKDVIHSVKCPWEGEHSEEHRNDTIIYANTDGTWPGFHCKHSHCEGRTIRDVLEVMGDADSFCSNPWGGSHEI